MTFPAGFFTALGIFAYLILWRYIFLLFFKLVKQSENPQDSLHETEPNEFDVLHSNCCGSSHENSQKPCRTVANILPQKQTIILNFGLFSTSALRIQPERCLIRSNGLPLRQLYRTIYNRRSALKEVENFEKFLNASKTLKCYSRSGIGRREKSTVTEKDRIRIRQLQNMEAVHDTVKDMQTPGNGVFKDIDEAFGTFEIVESHAIDPDTKPKAPQFRREEKDLNRMIRRLVAAELMKCCEKEHATMSRAHSETDNRVNWKRNKCNKQAVNLNANPAPFFDSTDRTLGESVCDSGSRETSIFPKKYDRNADVLGERMDFDSTQNLSFGINVTEGSQSPDCNNDNDNDKGGVESISIAEDDAPISYNDGEHRIKRPSNSGNVTSIQEPETDMIRTTRAEPTLDGIAPTFEDAATQTEHMYMIRAVRSCPGRRRGHRLLGTPRGMSKARSSGKAVPIEITSPAFLYRKASDNLIYEKGKGSRSPSYIPVPERFRWRYIMPTRVN